MTMKLTLASIISVLTICGMAWKLHVFLRQLENRFDGFEKTMNDNTVQILRMTLLSDDVPLHDRIHAGEEYIRLGGNGYGHIVYERLLKEVELEITNK